MAFLLPTPYAVAQVFVSDFNIIMIGLKQTFQAAFTGYIIATLLGITIATIMSVNKILERSLYPYAILLQTVPVVAVAPLIVLWFGFEIKSIIIISIIIALFPIINNTLLGLKSTSKTLVELFDYHKSNKFTSFLKLRFPAAIPNIIAGMKISAGLSVIGAIVGEFIIGSGSEAGGLGVQIIYAQANLETALVMALILTATCLGFAFFITISTLGWYLLHQWHESEQ
ncbi:MAG: ABC transporter ATP-binding protein [Euryarchaeota archaeon]|nr:ABC transporter ATP-binding protein [Euryarchaeota archaeon]